MRSAQDVRIGRVRLLRAHAVGEPGLAHVLGHLRAAPKLVDERLIEPWLVDAEPWIGEQPVAVEPLDVVPLERAAIPPDVHVVLLHGRDEQRAGHGTADGSRVEVGHPRRGNVKGAALEHGNPFTDELRTAVDQARFFSAVLLRTTGDIVVIRLVGLP